MKNELEGLAFQEARIDGEVLYEGRIVTLKLDRVRLPSGRGQRREVVEHTPAAVLRKIRRGSFFLSVNSVTPLVR